MEEYEYEIMYGLENTYWWFKGKQFLLEMLLNDHLDDDRSNRALDIGAGTGATLELLRKYGAAYGVEFSKVALRMLKQKGLNSIVRSDAEEKWGCVPLPGIRLQPLFLNCDARTYPVRCRRRWSNRSQRQTAIHPWLP